MKPLKILCFAAEQWTDIDKRNMCLIRALSERNSVASVLYVNPPVSSSFNDIIRGEFPPSHLGQKRTLHWNALQGRLTQQVTEKIWTYTGSRKTIPLTRFENVRRWKWLHRANETIYCRLIERCLGRLPGHHLVIWLSHPFHAFAVEAFHKRNLLVYDWIDAWESFDVLPVEEPETLTDLNQRILEGADVVLAVSQRLLQRAEAVNPNAFLLPNATDFPVSDPDVSLGSVPAAEIAQIPAPRIGYAGQIGDKFDFSLVRSIAQMRPDWSLVLVGPVWHTHGDKLTAFKGLDNVHFLGRRPRREMPALLGSFDVCMIPHLVNDLTLSMDPIKVYDYLTTGKPIVSTGVAGVSQFRDAIYVGHTVEEFLQGIEAALGEESAMRRRRLTYAEQNTWSRRADQVWKITVKALAEG